MRTTKTLIRLGGSESSLGAHASLLVLSCRGSNVLGGRLRGLIFEEKTIEKTFASFHRFAKRRSLNKNECSFPLYHQK